MIYLENCYVISEDLGSILNGRNALGYNYKDRGIKVPGKSFITDLKFAYYKLCKLVYNTKIEMCTEEGMKASMEYLISKYVDKYPIVSLDQIYIDCDNKKVYALDITRLTDSDEMVSRLNPLDKDGVRRQIERIASDLNLEGKKEIILLDDVIYSGSAIEYVKNMFAEYGINVIGAMAPLVGVKGLENLKDLPEGVNCNVMMMGSVVDEVCERDLFYGVAQSGMIKIENGVAYKAPYFLPFGDPVARASCPEEKKDQFSIGLCKISLALWEEIEKLSKRKIYNYELPERILNTDYNESVTKTLMKVSYK